MRSRQRGFTLLELIVVLVIVTVLLAVTAPQLAGRGQAARLGAAGHDLQTLANAARARSVLSGQVVGLMLSRDGRELRLIQTAETSNDGRFAGNTEEGKKDAVALVDLLPVRRLPEGIRASFLPAGAGKSVQDLIRFRPDGSADGGELEISDARGGRMRLEVVRPLGRLRLKGTS